MKPASTAASWPAINSGELRHRITFLRQTSVQDISGEGVAWLPDSPPFQVYAKIEPLSAAETIRNGQDIGQTMARVTVRYNAEIKDTLRFVSPNGGLWIIKAIQNLLEMDIVMVMTCSSLGPDRNA